MTTKTSRAIEFMRNGDWKNALAIFSTFRVGFTRDEVRSMEIAHECLCGHDAFYRSIGVDVDTEIAKSKEFLQKKYTLMHKIM